MVDYIARKQDDYLAPDASEDASEAAPKADSKPESQPPTEVKAPPAPQVLVMGGSNSATPMVLDEWRQSVALQMRAYIDPRLTGYRNVRMTVDEARDEAGHDLRRADFAKPRRVRLGTSADLSLPIALQLPRERGDKLHLRGALLLWVPARVATAEFALGDDGTATRQAIFWGQSAGLKIKLSQGEGKSWMLASDVEMKGDHGQLDFRREMGPALNDDDGYRAGLVLPGSVRVQSANGCEWKLRPFSEEQKLSLNAGADLISRKTDFVGAFRRGRTQNGSFEGSSSGGGGSLSSSGDVSALGIDHRNGILANVAPMPVPPDGYAYTENVTWQLEPGGTRADGGACGTGEGPPAITKILFDTPQEWREVRVPFDFKDLPLPPR